MPCSFTISLISGCSPSAPGYFSLRQRSPVRLTYEVALLQAFELIRYEQAVRHADRALTQFIRVIRGWAGFLLWQVHGSIVEGCKSTAKDRKADDEEDEAGERGSGGV